MDLSAALTYFTGLQSRIVARLESIDGTRFRQDQWTAPGRRRRRKPRARGGRRLRTCRCQFLACARRSPSAVGKRGSAATVWPRLRGDGRVAGAASAQSVPAHGAHERAPVRRGRQRRRAGLVVRRRHGPDAVLRLRRGRHALSPRMPRCACAIRRRLPRAFQALVRRVFLSQAPQRATWRRRYLFRRSVRSRLRSTASRCAQRRRRISGRV